MLDRLDPSALLVAYLQWIEKVAAIVCHKNGVWGDEADDFASLAKMKMLEDDYYVLRKFRGESDLKTYLATVVVQRFHEYARECWGRWRHSAAAERCGRLACDLETLVHREGCTLHEAGERLRAAGKTTASDTELARLLAQLPERAPLRPVQSDPDALDRAPGADPADARVRAAELAEHRRALVAELFRALERLEPEERLIVRMRYAEGRSVADIARGLGLDQKALYRRIDRLRGQLRKELEEAGVSRSDVLELLGGDEP